jgi:hypothetical protein
MILTATNQATQALEYAGKIAYSSKEVLEFSYKMARKYADSEGVYVECGVAAGAQVIALAAGAPNKTIYALDSFQGIPLPSNKDNQMPGIKTLSDWERRALPDPGKQALVSSGATSVPLKDVVQHIKNSGVSIQKIYFIEGWFEETLPEFECPPISILRLDGDLYNSTYVCLKYLYPKVIKRGLIIIDDWALPGCRQAVYDYFMSTIGVFELPLNMDFIINNNSTVSFWEK